MVAISLRSESAPTPAYESAPTPAALIDGGQMLVVELREVGEAAVEGGVVAVGRGRRGKRAEYRCTACGYGIVVYGQAPSCPMCSEARWEHVEWRPFSQPLDDVALPSGSRCQRRHLGVSSPTAGGSIRYLRPGRAGASLER